LLVFAIHASKELAKIGNIWIGWAKNRQFLHRGRTILKWYKKTCKKSWITYGIKPKNQYS
jgi:hypothetical protein